MLIVKEIIVNEVVQMVEGNGVTLYGTEFEPCNQQLQFLFIKKTDSIWKIQFKLSGLAVSWLTSRFTLVFISSLQSRVFHRAESDFGPVPG